VKALFAQCGGLVHPPLNAHIPNGQTEDVAMGTLNPSVEKECASMCQVEGD
jgi:hypothetical protein